MARLGIDFGTTNTVAVRHDRGMFPIVLHTVQTSAGPAASELFPSAVYYDRSHDAYHYGLEAKRCYYRAPREPTGLYIRSIKRELRNFASGALVRRGDGQGHAFNLQELLTRFLEALRASVRAACNFDDDEPLESVISWPANANGAQRYITRHCFRQAGFNVVASVNEPTASAIEYANFLAQRQAAASRRQPMAVAIFDLGGGTFDASLVRIEGSEYSVIDCAGVGALGGDDFDEVLLHMFLAKMKADAQDLRHHQLNALRLHAQAQKEGLCSCNAKSIALDPSDYGLAGRPVSVRVADYFARLRPMLNPAVDALAAIVNGSFARAAGIGLDTLDAIYLVGGSSRLPLVPETVIKRFPHTRLVLTDKPFSSVAMGAALIAAGEPQVNDIFGRHFGVIRLADDARREVFDPIFPAGTRLPRFGDPPIEVRAQYHPRHNVGHLRYLECAAIDKSGTAKGNLRAWSDLFFPYDPAIPLDGTVDPADIVATDAFAATVLAEVYRCDADGVITVELQRPATGESRTHEIFHD